MSFQIAIDGPVAAGKGTVASLLAKKLNFTYIDTGAMYRMSALLAERNNIAFDDEEKIVKLAQAAHMDMHAPVEEEKDGRLTTVLLNDEDVSWLIRTEKVSAGSSAVAVLPNLRKTLVKKQQEIASNKDVVMEGRDITYRVLPNADIKIYLTANDIVRSRRRHMQNLMKGFDVSFEQVYKELLERDEQDSNRESDPLRITPDAWVIDNSDLDIIKTVDIIIARVTLLRSQK